MFELSGMDDMLGPLEGMCVLGIGICESVDGLTQIPGGGGRKPPEGLPPQYAEPTLYLVEPGGVGRRVMEVNIGMLDQPPVVFRLMSIQVVQDDMEFPVGIVSHGLVHKIQELPAAATQIVADTHQAGGHLQCGEQGRGAMPLVLVAKSPQSLPIGEVEPSLRALQRGWPPSRLR